MTDHPTLRVLSLGAGVQSTALAILAIHGHLPPLDAAIFADTGWEPASVYWHLSRLDREVLRPARIPLYRVSSGHIRRDALDPGHRFASMPLFVRNRDGGDGMARRQCTGEYKLKPIKERVRVLLGAGRLADGRIGQPKRGRWAEQWVGISTDEAHRALDAKHTLYAVPSYPLLDLGLSRDDCRAINADAGFPDTPKSACIGCPFHSNAQWRDLRDNYPDEWADACDFDRQIRFGSARANAAGQPLRGQMFLHRSRVPLDQAPIDHVTAREWADRQETLPDVSGCSPHFCRTPVT
jgi:hypothetical protein